MRHAARCALLGMLVWESCAKRPAEPAPTHEMLRSTQAKSAGAEGGGETPSCPRVERAQRMWSGFLVDVPSAAMVHALDVVVPIQAALGRVFCPPVLWDCRPTALLSINLTDAEAREAHLGLRLDTGGASRELALTMRSESNSWGADPTSLARYLASCRAPKPQTPP